MSNNNGAEPIQLRCTSTEACVHTAEVAVLAEKIAELESRITTDTLERAYAHNDDHDPLSRLPPEIATAILLHARYPPTRPYESYYLNPNPLFYLNPDAELPTRPLELAAVCKHWRNLVFAEPSLWTTVVMRRTQAKREWNLPLELVQQWVARAGALPLRFVLRWDPKGEPLDNVIIALVKYVCSLSHRWRSVAFRVPSALLSFLHCDSAATVDMEHFTFISTDGECSLSLGKTTIRPDTVMLAGISTPPAQIQWTNVTELNMRWVISGALLGILPNLTRATKISASFIRNDAGMIYPTPTTPIDLPNLNDFNAESIEINDLTTFFPHLRAPNLVCLSITSESELEDLQALPLTTVRRLFLGSDNIRGLLLSGIAFEIPSDLMTLLETLPELCNLSLTYGDSDDGGPVTDALFRRLALTVKIRNDDDDSSEVLDTFLPDLEFLSYTGPRAFSWPVIADFLETHIKCRGLRGRNSARVPRNLRPFVHLGLNIVPQILPGDLIEEEVLERFMTLPGSWVRADIDKELMDASFEHHEMGVPDRVFAWPDFDDM